MLIISASKRGSLNRMGDASLKYPPESLQMGHEDPALFQEFIEAVQPEWFDYAGRYEFPGIADSISSIDPSV